MNNDNDDCFFELSKETFRLETFNNINNTSLNELKNILAKAGFYYTKKKFIIKCFRCGVEIDASKIDQNKDDIVMIHKQMQPDCEFINTPNVIRSKKYHSCKYLLFEKYRLETFIEWPIPFISPKDLAASGFIYLRTHDHCACIFCRGIVGMWEIGDIPKIEHVRHFHHCPFITGKTVGNIPINHSIILDKMLIEGEESPILSYKYEHSLSDPISNIFTKGNTNNYDTTGLKKYSGPKKKQFITLISRINSYENWPERIKQTPEEMANAGFYYTGFGDHVRCFFCDKGLHNWENEDNPLEEHARWYPYCNFVYLLKGKEYIDEIIRKKPPNFSSCSGNFNTLTETDIDTLMENDIIKSVVNMDFSFVNIRTAFCRNLKLTGLPFLSLESCIEAVLKIMEEEEIKRLLKLEEEEKARRGVGNNDSKNENSSQMSNQSNFQHTGDSNHIYDESNNISIAQTILEKETPKYSYENITKDLNINFDSKTCLICMDADINVVFLPCNHMIACGNCTSCISQCPICRKNIDYFIRPIIP